MHRTAIYLRISLDPDGSQTATARQLEDCRKYAEGKGWTVVDVFEDVDLSAYKRGVRRPEFERLVAAVQAGEIDTVLAWKLDRLTRRLREFSRLDEECETAHANIVTVVDAIDTSTSAGRVIATIMTGLARAESENIGTRVKRKHEALAKAGAASKGGSRCFGYSTDRQTVDDGEAALIREAADRVIAGEGLRAICADWERRGVKTTEGNGWQRRTLRRALLSPAISAQRRYGGQLVPGTWPAIVAPDTSSRLAVILGDEDRRRNAIAGTKASYLLSGMLRCGVCGAHLAARPRSDGTRRYVCARDPGKDNCGKIARVAEPVEATVTAMLFAALDGPGLQAAMAEAASAKRDDGGALLAAITADESALTELSRDYYVDKRITKAQFYAANDAIENRIAANRAQLARRSGANIISMGSDALQARWTVAPMEWKRTLLASVIDHVVIATALKGRHTFDPSLIQVVWKY